MGKLVNKTSEPNRPGRIPAGMDYKKELAKARMEKIQKTFADDKG